MTINVALAPEGTSPAHQARAQLPVLSAAGVNDMASLARQQLPGAVPALALVAAYNANAQPQPKLPTLRSSAAAPSSALAAQFIAQGAAESEADLAVFAPRPAAETALPVPEFLSDLRMARGDFSARAKAVAPESPLPMPLPKPEPMAGLPLKTSLTQLAAGLPSLLLQPIKQMHLFSARGLSAYQLALKRNAALAKIL